MVAMRIVLAVVFIGGLFFSPVLAVGILDLPQTGQVKCYNTVDPFGEVPCAGTGQDGEYLAGVSWPSRRFAVGGDCVTDNLTGLMWPVNANLPGGPLTWNDAIDFSMNLTLCGYSDWRLANVIELESLVDLSRVSPSLPTDHPFVGVRAAPYWSSTAFPIGSDVRFVSFNDGGIGQEDGSPYFAKQNYVWPVRTAMSGPEVPARPWRTGQTVSRRPGDDGDLQAGVPWPEPRFSETAEGLITDNLTGLMWTMDAGLPGPVECSPGITKDWQGVLDHIRCLNNHQYLGYSDWRVPNRKELMSLKDWARFEPGLPVGHPFVNVWWKNYWSSSPAEPIWVMSGQVWLTGIWYSVGCGFWGMTEAGSFKAWPVRGGVVHATLGLTLSGTGAGTVTSSPAGIDCGSGHIACTHAYPLDTVVTLTAMAEKGSSFVYWSGACSGTEPVCTIAMTATAEVAALFTKGNPKDYTLTIAKTRPAGGDGTVTSADGGIDCGKTCSRKYREGTVITLTAGAAKDSTFTGWSGGGCYGTGSCTVRITEATRIAAAFEGARTLKATKTSRNKGSGTVTSSPAGIDCGSACSARYPAGTLVTLTAAADAESAFIGWSGGGCYGLLPCTVRMDGAKNVKATFEGPYRLKVVKASRSKGDGTVTSAPAGIDCGNACQATYPVGTKVTLTAKAGAGSLFLGWSPPALCSGTATCNVTMDKAHAVQALFSR